MATATITFAEKVTIKIIPLLQAWSTDGATEYNSYDNTAIVLGGSYSFSRLIYNEKGGTIRNRNEAVNVRVAARTTIGYYTGETDANGQELVTEQWWNVRVGSTGAYTAIGGNFSMGSANGNSLYVGSVQVGSYEWVDFQLVTPTGAGTTGQFGCQIVFPFEF